MRVALAGLVVCLGGACGSSAGIGGVDGSPAVDSSPSVDAQPLPARVLALDSSPFGVNSHLAGDDMLQSFADIGLRWHRIDIDWSYVEPEQGQYNWEQVDRVVDTADSLGFSILATVGYTPSWASGQANQSAPPLDPNEYLDFLRLVVDRYGDRIACMAVWNEPNLNQFWSGSKSQFIDDILVPGLIAIRLQNPDMVTCGPDLSSAGNERVDWLGPILDGAGGYIDVITHHQYDGNDTVAGRAAEIDRLREFVSERGQGGKPLWITEIGWHRDHVTDAEQADLLRGVMAEMGARAFWTKTFWYDSHGEGWGLLGPDATPERGVPRDSYYAYGEVIADL